MRDRPMARPLFAQDTVGSGDLELAEFLSLTKNPSQDSEFTVQQNTDSEALVFSKPTPPPGVLDDDDDSHLSLDPILRSLLDSPSDSPFEARMASSSDRTTLLAKNDLMIESSQSQVPAFELTRRRGSTPTAHLPHNKRQRLSKKGDQKPVSLPTDSPDSSKDLFGIKSMISQLPSKEERVQAQLDASAAQERMTSKITDVMSNIITTNRALELATKKEIALEERQAKNRMARSSMVVELVPAGKTLEAARIIAHQELPDL